MDSDNDFTFCQVRPSVNQNVVEVNRNLPDISGISLKDESPNVPGDDQDSVFSWKDNLPNNVRSKQGSVGSLSFNVIETSPQTKSSELSRQLASEDASSSDKVAKVHRIAARKPAARVKVPFEKGFSPMDWLKLTRTHPDLAGLKGMSNRRFISMKEVKQHQTEGAMWTVLKGRVYNLSPYLKFHPGGVDKIVNGVGKDCTSLFNKYHAWVNAEFLLEKCLVGVLDDSH